VAGAKPARRPVAALVEAMGPPVARVPWSSKFAVQTIEILPVALGGAGGAVWLKPVHAESLRIGMRRGSKPAELVLQAIGWYSLEPVVVHSTSWRQEDGRVVLTYLVVVKPPTKLPPGSLAVLPVARTRLARGEAMAAPAAIDVEAVLEHALRHLAWLIREDAAVCAALGDWQAVLSGYEPEPFQALSG
jgi:hypothetical protein